jgi:hypothetical protein
MLTTLSSLEELVKTDREAFRAYATDVLSRFTPEDRETAVSIETPATDAGKVLKTWQEQIEPIYQDLEDTRTDPKFKKSIIRYVGFHDNEADDAVDYMINERRAHLLDEVLDNLYPSLDEELPYQRAYAAELLSQSEVNINDFLTRYQAYVDTIEVAEKHNVTICDPHSSWLERQRCARQIYKERQRIMQDEINRLEEIDIQLERLVNDPESLLREIVAKNWDFITLLDLRAKYQKQVDALSDTDQKNPSKKLQLFERVTKSFRERETERLAENEHTHSLKKIRHTSENVYNLLLDIFDLSHAARNRLLLDIQRYTRLTQERNMIQLIQHNREQSMQTD